jgi:hypothetical protein
MAEINVLVVLGQALSPDMKPPALLVERLECAASLSQNASADFPIYVCGGDTAKCGLTEVKQSCHYTVVRESVSEWGQCVHVCVCV